MADLNFGMLDLIAEQLDKHKQRLGPLHRPLVLLIGSVLFLVFLGLLIGAPIIWMEDFVYMAVLQVCLVAAFFMLLLTIPLNVYDRFVFCMALFIIFAAAPVMVTLGYFFDLLHPDDPEGFTAVVSSAKPEIFMYALLRGLGHLAWALPPLFVYFTFYPQIASKGASQLQSSVHFTFWTALAIHTIASALHVWLGGTTKVFKPVNAASDYLASEIDRHQTGFLVFQGLYILLGYVTVYIVRRWHHDDDKRWLAIVVGGILAVQGCYMVASYNNRQIIVRYPASRTSADYVQALELDDTGRYVFRIPRPNTISDKFDAFRTYAVCESPESLKFTLRVADAGAFQAQYRETSLGNVPDTDRFCQPAEFE